MYSFFTYEATVYRTSYVDNKSSYGATGDKYKWYLKALQIKDWIEESMFWKEYNFTTDINADIKDWDRLEIDWETYTVKWSAKFKALDQIEYLRLVLNLWSQ